MKKKISIKAVEDTGNTESTICRGCLAYECQEVCDTFIDVMRKLGLPCCVSGYIYVQDKGFSFQNILKDK